MQQEELEVAIIFIRFSSTSLILLLYIYISNLQILIFSTPSHVLQSMYKLL